MQMNPSRTQKLQQKLATLASHNMTVMMVMATMMAIAMATPPGNA